MLDEWWDGQSTQVTPNTKPKSSRATLLIVDRTIDLNSIMLLDYSYQGLVGELLRLDSDMNLSKVPELEEAVVQHAQ